jgi:hypothetical protein
MSEKSKYHPKNSFESMISVLSTYNNLLGIKPMLPAEIVPFHYYREEAISVIDNTKELTLRNFSPEDIAKRLQVIESNTKTETHKILAEHFGNSFEAKITTFSTKQNDLPEGRKIVYKRSLAQKLLKVIMWPEYTLELIGFDGGIKGTNHRVSIGVTSYRDRKGKQMLVYSYFEENIGATIAIGSPQLSDSFKNRLTEVFKLDQ